MLIWPQAEKVRARSVYLYRLLHRACGRLYFRGVVKVILPCLLLLVSLHFLALDHGDVPQGAQEDECERHEGNDQGCSDAFRAWETAPVDC